LIKKTASTELDHYWTWNIKNTFFGDWRRHGGWSSAFWVLDKWYSSWWSAGL